MSFIPSDTSTLIIPMSHYQKSNVDALCPFESGTMIRPCGNQGGPYSKAILSFSSELDALSPIHNGKRPVDTMNLSRPFLSNKEIKSHCLLSPFYAIDNGVSPIPAIKSQAIPYPAV
jgi:hypothetical protein